MTGRIEYDGIDEFDEEKVIDGNFEDITELQNDIDGDLNSIFQEFGGDSNDTEFKIFIRRVIPNTGETEHCFSCLPSELPVIDRIKNEYGHGAYKINIYKNKKLFRKLGINIAKKIDQPNNRKSQENINGLIDIILTNQKEQSERFEALLMSVAGNNNNQPTSDPMTMMSSMVGMMVQMKEFVVPQTGTDKFSDMLEVVKIVKEIGGDGEGSGRNFMDGMVDLGKSFGPGILEITKKLNSESTIKKPVTQDMTEKTTEDNQAITEDNQAIIDAQQMEMFKMQVGMLVYKASTKSDPALYADLVLDSIPDEKIKEFISKPDVIGYLITINPEVDKYKEWFSDLIAEINAALDEPDETGEKNENNFSENNVVNEIPNTSTTATQTNQ